MKKIFIFIITIFIIFTIYLIFSDANNYYASVINTLDIWLMKVFPSIFTFFVFSSILINLKIINVFSFFLKPLNRIFKFETHQAFNIYLLSILNGNPSTILFINKSFNLNEITIKDSDTLLKCASFVNPLFILAFFNLKISIILIISHLFSNFIICIYLNRKNKPLSHINNIDNKIELNSFFSSINDEIRVLLLIACMMVICNIIKYSLKSFMTNKIFEVIFSLIELSTGLYDIIHLNLNQTFTVCFSSFLLSFACFSIHLQVFSVLDKKLKFKNYFNTRIIQGLTSIIFTFIILSIT